MKMVKSLLLGSAAGLVAVAGAQAADLPVKAKAVEYVKVCSMYGAGFYYIPGTDTCLKVGGWIQTDWNFGGGSTDFWYGYNTAGSRQNREDTQDTTVRNRAYITLDARTQTEYGTLRAYIRNGWEFNTAQNDYRGVPLFDAAFIQFAGFTVGRTRTFFDFYGGQIAYAPLSGANGNPWVNVITYTANFGGGFSGSIGVEDAAQHRAQIWDATANPLSMVGQSGGVVAGTGPTGWGNYAGGAMPDVVANLRVDQPWGSAQISGAVHQVRAGYYCGSAGTQVVGPQCGAVSIAAAGVPENGHPEDRLGFAVLGGLKLNLPWAKGDEFWAQAIYSHGASNYQGYHPYFGLGQVGLIKGRDAAYGMPFDAVFRGNPTGVGDPLSNLELVSAWSVMAGIQHYWTPTLRSSLFGSYLEFDYPAAAATIFCTSRASVAGGTAAGTVASVPAGCNPDFAVWHVGTRTIWNPVANLDIGLEVLYTRIDQNHVGNWLFNSTGGVSGGLYRAADLDNWSGTIRFQRNFWP